MGKSHVFFLERKMVKLTKLPLLTPSYRTMLSLNEYRRMGVKPASTLEFTRSGDSSYTHAHLSFSSNFQVV
jgi:hypothetical protein